MAKKYPKPAYVSDEWQVNDDLQTLIRAKEIKADAKRYAKAKALAKHKLECMANVVAGAN